MGLPSALFSHAKKTSRKSLVVSCSCSVPYIILDVETTGLNPATDKIIQLSAIKYSTQGIPTDTYDTYLNPGVHIPSKITNITGISDEMVQNTPISDQIKDQFLSFISDFLLVGYNISFDLRFLAAEFGDFLNDREYVDALPLARRFLCCSDYKLSTVAEECGFSPDNGFHNSLVDCEAVAAVLSYLDMPFEECSKRFFVSQSSQGQRTSSTGSMTSSYRTNLKNIVSQKSCFDPLHPFYQKNVVFTGTLGIERADAAQFVVDVGGFVKSAVSGKTDFLVVGSQDINLVGEDGMSSKEEKAFTLNQAGKAHIKVLCESEFLQMIHRRTLT